MGKSRSAIANLLRLRSLPDSVKKLVESEKLSAGHARCLLPLEDEKRITDAAKTIVENELSVREAEALVKELLDPASSQSKAAKKPKKLPLEMREAQDELSNVLATKVQLTGNRQKGRISISYYSAEQLNELYETLRKI